MCQIEILLPIIVKIILKTKWNVNPEKLLGILLMEQKEDESGGLDTKETVFYDEWQWCNLPK